MMVNVHRTFTFASGYGYITVRHEDRDYGLIRAEAHDVTSGFTETVVALPIFGRGDQAILETARIANCEADVYARIH